MKNKTTYITITNARFYDTIKEDASQGETNWTVNKSTKAGDTILLYVCAPVSAIVAVGTASIDSWREDDLNSPWYGSHMTDMHGLELLTTPITRARLMNHFPDWGYWKQPRICVAVKKQFIEQLEKLVAIHKRPFSEEQINQLIKRILPIAKQWETLMTWWIRGDDNCFLYCYDCCVKEIAKQYPGEDIDEYIDGGFEVDSDSEPFCETCGHALKFLPTNYAREGIIEHFESTTPDLTDPNDCDLLIDIVTDYNYHSAPNLKVEALIERILSL